MGAVVHPLKFSIKNDEKNKMHADSLSLESLFWENTQCIYSEADMKMYFVCESWRAQSKPQIPHCGHIFSHPKFWNQLRLKKTKTTYLYSIVYAK